MSGTYQRKHRIGMAAGQEAKDRPVAPRYIGVHIRQTAHEAERQVIKPAKQDAPDTAQRLDIGIRTMRHARTPKQLGHGRELM